MKTFIFLFIISINTSFAQNTYFITPHVGGSSMFCKNVVSRLSFEANNSNILPLATIGINFEVQKTNISYLFGIESDNVGYSTKELTSTPTPNSFFKNVLGEERYSGSSGNIQRVFMLFKLPIFRKYIVPSEEKKFYIKPYLVTGFSYDWSSYDFEASPFISDNGLKDIISTGFRYNVSLWLGTHIAFCSKKRRLFELQITYKQGIQTLFTVARYNINTKEVYQILASRGSTLNVCLAFPIHLFRKRK